MDSLLKSALRRSVIGFALGLLAEIGILCLLSPGTFAEGAGRLAVCLFTGSLYGAIAVGASVAYDVDRWSLTRATLTHLLVALGGLYVLGLVQGWLTLSLYGFVVPTLGFIALYFLIWLAQSLSLRHKVRQMNLGLKDWKTPKNRTLEEE